MNKKTLLGLSAILFVLAGTSAYSNCAGLSGGGDFSNQGGLVQSADAPLPPIPWALSSQSDLRADAPLPPIPWPWALSVPSDGRVS